MEAGGKGLEDVWFGAWCREMIGIDTHVENTFIKVTVIIVQKKRTRQHYKNNFLAAIQRDDFAIR